MPLCLSYYIILIIYMYYIILIIYNYFEFLTNSFVVHQCIFAEAPRLRLFYIL